MSAAAQAGKATVPRFRRLLCYCGNVFAGVAVVGGGYMAWYRYHHYDAPRLLTFGTESCKSAMETILRGIKSPGEGFLGRTLRPDARSMPEPETAQVYDIAVVGGGIVGLAVCREIQKRYPKLSIALLEKEPDVAQHMSNHNSGVIHAGFYYEPGSSMARICVRGQELMYDYCSKNKLPHSRCGKLVVASTKEQIEDVEKLYDNGVKNGVKDLKILRSLQEIQAIEPVVVGEAALWSPNSGIADYGAVARHIYKSLLALPLINYKEKSASGRSLTISKPAFTPFFNCYATDFAHLTVRWDSDKSPKTQEEVVAIAATECGHTGPRKFICARNVITCCGLMNDLVARATAPHARDVKGVSMSFRGRYYQLRPHATHLIHTNVYPCPNRGGGLAVGIHFTPTCNEDRGSTVICGPGNAPCLSREGYSWYSVDVPYTLGMLSPMVMRFAWRNWSSAWEQLFSDISRKRFLQGARRLVPQLKEDDFEDSFAGVMATAMHPDGTSEPNIMWEFVTPRDAGYVLEVKDGSYHAKPGASKEPRKSNGEEKSAMIMNLRNTPSPAATSSLAVGEEVCNNAREKLSMLKP